LPRPRDVFRLHDNGAFRDLYDAIWADLERQVGALRTGTAS
jgi:NitT/TauT family transport system ATP-binding protein